MANKKIIYTILLVSLGINLFLAGAVTTHMMHRGPGLPPPPAERFDMMAARDALQSPYREQVDKIWEKFRGRDKVNFEGMFKLRRQLRDLLTAEDFDQAAFDQTYNEVLNAEGEMRHSLHQVMQEIATTLPPDERRKYFQAGFSHERRGPGEWRERPPPGR